MPRKKKRQSKKPAEENTNLVLRIDGYDVRSEAAINRDAHAPQYAWRDTQEEPLYEFETHLEISAVCTEPEKRAGDTYELTIYGEVSPESDIYWKLRDIHVVDDNRVRKYRAYRGRQIPVYAPPKGMGTLNKARGEPRWHAAIWAQPRHVNDLLALLGYQQQLYMSILERKIARHRWIESLTVQTSDPREE